MNDPLTIPQLEALGFSIGYKKRGPLRADNTRELVFNCCSLSGEIAYQTLELVGTFYKLPTFEEIVEQIATNAKQAERDRIIEIETQKLTDAYS